jgi:hypothetical protein
VVQRLEQRHREGELVGARIDAAVAELLRCHVRRRAHDGAVVDAGGGERRRGRRGRDLRHLGGADPLELAITREREAEVEHDHATVAGEHDVAGLEVAVDQASCVGRREPAAGGDHPRRPHVPPLASPQQRRERLALDELHREPHAAGLQPDVVDLRDVDVVEPRERAGLSHEPRLGARAGLTGIAVEKLDCDASIELGIVRGPHDAHAATTELAREHESPRPRGQARAAAARRQRRVREGGVVAGRSRGVAHARARS